MSPADWGEWSDLEASRIHRAGQWRAPRSFDPSDPRGLVSFASNDYLGLTRHPAVMQAAHDAIDRWGTGAGAARLIVGSRPVHDELEAELAEWKGTEAAVLFATGFAANLGVLGTFAGPDVLVVSDELNHASLIDGRRLAGAPLAVYRHADAAHVDELLRASDAPRAIVVTETVFSMDGDVAPVDKLAEVCAQHRALLVLDEAHAVLGPAVELDDVEDIDVLRVGTLSKTLGALGGFVAGPKRFTDLLVNRARSYIFTTASTPADAAAALAALRVLCSPEGDALRARLHDNIQRLRPGHPSPIVPYVCGSEARALEAATALFDDGLLVTAIRPPTVPPGTARLRVALSAAHTADQIDTLAAALARLFPDPAREGR
jgi:8-amino-7-oxononanoate synthase